MDLLFIPIAKARGFQFSGKDDYKLNADMAQLSPEERAKRPFVVAWNG